MSDALLKAKTHFSKFRSPEKLLPIDVKEWDLTVYYYPHMSIGERRSINIAAQVGMRQVGGEMQAIVDRHGRDVMALVVRGRDQHGVLLFHESQFNELMKCDTEIIERVVSQMVDEYTDPENATKN